MIEAVRIRRFKRFGDLEFRFPGSVILAGPNDSGKTTALQAIAAFALALRTWRYLNDFNPRRGFVKAPITRLGFSPVPLQSFHQLWNDRQYAGIMEVEVRHRSGWTVAMEFHPDTTEQIFVRPRRGVDGDLLRTLDFDAVFIPAMTGVETNERFLQPSAVEQILGTGNPGQVLRNLLIETHRDDAAWKELQESVGRLFGYRLLPPNPGAAFVFAEYEPVHGGPRLDLSTGGSGFRQVVMLLALLGARRNTVALLDEPDAHLDVILQDAIWRQLRLAALRGGSQLIAATHSEALINAVDPRELCLLLDTPQMARGPGEDGRPAASPRVLSNMDLMRAVAARRVLYVEDYADRAMLFAWARILDHPAERLLEWELLRKPVLLPSHEDRPRIQAKTHFDALRLLGADLPGLQLLDDEQPETTESPVSGSGLQRLGWRSHRIENCLLHPDALARFVERELGAAAAAPAIEALREQWRHILPPALARNPHCDHPIVRAVRAATEFLPPLLAAAGIHDLPYTRYSEIAALMLPEEIHPEVIEKLDAICRAFRNDGETVTRVAGQGPPP